MVGKRGGCVEQVWVFWATAAGMALAVAAFLWSGLARGTSSGEDTDVAVYRDQLAEIARDEARGLIAGEEAARLTTEVSRRLLAADRAAHEVQAAKAPGRGWLAAGIVLALAAGGWGYWTLGAPGYPDLGLARRVGMAEEFRLNRPNQAEAEVAQPAATAIGLDAAAEKLLADLRAAVASRPDDQEGQRLLARFAAEAGLFAVASGAQGRVVALKGDAATAGDHLQHADFMIRAAGGYVSPEAEAALTRALTLAPDNGMARYYSGLMLAQTGRPDQAFRLWRALLDTSPPDAPWLPPLRASIEDVAAAAGERFTLADAGGPTVAGIGAAAGMADDDRQAMIEGMVEGLAGRLASGGGPAEDWARLITSLGVLGDAARARAILAEAETMFAASPDDLALVRQAARVAGIAE
jgi:cytochrome c-type biogenesis protein CcmH